MKRILTVLLLGGLLAGIAYAAEGPESVEARSFFQKALAGNGGVSPDTALARFEALQVKEPGNPMYEAYSGACLTLKGRDSWFPWKKMSYTEQGLDKIDNALSFASAISGNDENSVRTRLVTQLVAAQTFLAVPNSIFNRANQGKKLLLDISRSPEYEKMGTEFRGMVQKALSAIKEKS
jgi:hypothetical protein